jgi:hypothetical protein
MSSIHPNSNARLRDADRSERAAYELVRSENRIWLWIACFVCFGFTLFICVFGGIGQPGSTVGMWLGNILDMRHSIGSMRSPQFTAVIREDDSFVLCEGFVHDDCSDDQFSMQPQYDPIRLAHISIRLWPRHSGWWGVTSEHRRVHWNWHVSHYLSRHGRPSLSESARAAIREAFVDVNINGVGPWDGAAWREIMTKGCVQHDVTEFDDFVSYYDRYEQIVPHWPGYVHNLVTLVSLLLCVMAVRGIFQARAERARWLPYIRRLTCQRCDYDLRGCEHERCPECGCELSWLRRPEPDGRT